MRHAEHEITIYCPELMIQVVNLLQQYLWGGNIDTNKSYFTWKYCDNPYAEYPTGIVALYNGTVVGFRGYFATRWQVHEKNNEIIVLCPGDTCVHPDHRMKGLSMLMGKMAMEEYSSKYKAFLNLSSTKSSVPGYLKMGFTPLINKTYLTRYSLPGLIRFILAENKRLAMPDNKLSLENSMIL